MSEPNFSAGNGSVAEALLDVNPTISISPRGVFQVCNLLATYAGAGILRIRETNLGGAELFRVVFAAAGSIPMDFRTAPMEFRAGETARTLVLTQEGNSTNSVTISGQ